MDAVRDYLEKTQPTPQAVETPIEQTPVEPTPVEPTPSEPTPIEPTPTEPTSLVNWQDFGVETPDELKAKLAKLSEYEPIVNKYNELAPQISVLDQVKNPFANDTIAQLNNFVNKTGISNLGLASEILSASTEDLQRDPLKAVAIKEILDNPSLSTLSMAQLREYVAQKNGVDLSEYGSEEYAMPITLTVDGTKAIQNIEEKRKEFANINNYFVDLQNNTKEQQRLLESRVEKWNVATPSILSSVREITVKVPSVIEGLEDVTVKVAVSPEEVQKSFEAIRGYFAQNVDATTESLKQVQDVIVNNLRLAKQDEILKQSILATEGKLREKIVKESHNLAPITDQRLAPPKDENVVVSPNVEALKKKFGIA